MKKGGHYIMLMEIKCDRFGETHQAIKFKPGLNTILGSTSGSNAIGKSTFLWIIDYVFGGDSYYKISDDIEENIGPHIIYFTFQFDDHLYYFYRSTEEPKHVVRTDKNHNFINKISLDEYRNFLLEEYKVRIHNIKFSEMTERFYRIYGRENTLEKYPLLLTPRESDENAVNFLLKLFGHYHITEEIKRKEDELGIKYVYKSRQRHQVSAEKIELNQKTIESLRERLQELIKSNEEAQLSALGFDTKTFETVTSTREEMKRNIRKRNKLISQINAIKDNLNSNIYEVASEFESLSTFFPNINLKAFEEIENFHLKIREILGEEISEETERLQSLIAHYDKEILHLQKKVEESGLAKEMSERTLSQCISVSKNIDTLEAETKELIRQKELQDSRNKAENKLEQLLKDQSLKLKEIQDAISLKMQAINDIVTEKQERGPKLYINSEKEISFETPGNTSEGTAYKSLIIYDLSILELCPIPGLIHDSNILKRIEDKHLEHILNRYQESNKQVFIAFDKADSTTKYAQNILEETAILHLSNENVLYGHSWSKSRTSRKEQEGE